MNKKGILNEMQKVPAWKRLMNDPKIKQMVEEFFGKTANLTEYVEQFGKRIAFETRN